MMSKLDAYKAFLGTKPLHMEEISTAFQFGNEHIFTSDEETLIDIQNIIYAGLKGVGISMAEQFNGENNGYQATLNARYNNEGGVFCTICHPIKGTEKLSFAIVIGRIIDQGDVIDKETGQERMVGTFDMFFALTGEILEDDYFFPHESRVMMEIDGDSGICSPPLEKTLKQHICYADEAFSAIIAGRLPSIEDSQYWFQEEAPVKQQYAYISRRKAPDLAKEIMEIEGEMDRQMTLIPLPAFYQ